MKKKPMTPTQKGQAGRKASPWNQTPNCGGRVPLRKFAEAKKARDKQGGYIDTDLLFGGVLVVLIVASVAGLLWLIVVSSARERAAWDAFKTEHRCRVVGKVAPETSIGSGVGFGSKGNIVPIMTTTYTAEKTGWQCDDGITYWR